jgi:hypothetical protein
MGAHSTRKQLQIQLDKLLPQIDNRYGQPNGSGGFHGDSNETMVFSRQLEYVYSRLYEIEYPEARWRTILPVDTSVPSGAQSHTYRMIDEVGDADVIDSYAEDEPMIEGYGTETAQKIIPVRNAFFYSIQDLRAAAMAGVDLDTRKATSARRIMERKLDVYAAVGVSKYSLTGAANDANVPLYNVGSPPAGTTLVGGWGTASAAQIISDIEIMSKVVFDQTIGVHGSPDNGTLIDMVLPTALYSIIASKRTDTFNNQSILAYVQNSIPFIRGISSWGQLNTAGASSVRRIMLGHMDPDVISAVLPQDFETFPIQPKGLGFITRCHARWGGTVVRYPKAMAYVDGM